MIYLTHKHGVLFSVDPQTNAPGIDTLTSLPHIPGVCACLTSYVLTLPIHSDSALSTLSSSLLPPLPYQQKMDAVGKIIAFCLSLMFALSITTLTRERESLSTSCLSLVPTQL